MAEIFDLESLVCLEQTFFDAGYTEGHAHGRIHGLIEGRALGREKGFEMWEELGFYEGFAKGWRAILQSRSESSSERAMQHIRHLLDLINQFPQVNPSQTASSTQEIDILKLQRQIRSRYRALCSCLGVRPRMQLVSGSTPSPVLDGDAAPLVPESLIEAEPDSQQKDEPDTPSIRLPNRVAPGSAIPVWKIDNKSGLKSAVTNMDLSF